MKLNAAQCLLESGADPAIALECGDTKTSYGALRAAVAQAGGTWKAMGLKPDDRVIVFAPDSIDWVVSYLGILWAGGVAIGINCRLAMADLAPILVESEVSAIWCEDEHADAIRGMAGCLTQPPRVVVAHADGAGGWHGLMALAAPIDAVERLAEDPALWIGTSGTTGIPKGVIHAQRTVLNAHSFARELIGLTAADRLYATSKLFFAYALGNSLFSGLRAGATVILDREWPTPERVAEMVEKHQPTLFFSVPTLYHKMLQTGIGARLAGTGIRHYVSAGQPLPPDVPLAWREATGKAQVSGYGTSETLCLMLYCDRDDATLAPTPLTEIRFADDADPVAPQRIWVRHSTVALGYWHRPEAEADGFAAGGWYSPGDMFLRRDDGRLEFTGRNDDMLKIAGQWVSTLWVEQALAAACGDSIQQIASVGVTTADGLTALSVLAVATPGAEALAAERMQQGIAGLPGHRRPRWVHWLDALPLTATGKLQRGQLRRLHEAAVAAGKRAA
jgi:acyl-coenzyme A synthetase/AMP-(fatty) acid ligase